MSENNANEMKLAKFESFVEKISKKIYNLSSTSSTLSTNYSEPFFSKSGILPLVFGSDDINNYSDIINDIFSKKGCFNYVLVLNYNVKVSKNISKRIEQLQTVISYINGLQAQFRVVVVFVLLMSLAVDKTDYEERLSTVCDVAVMLEISDEEMADIVQVVRYLYRDLKAEDVDLKTDRCKLAFRELIPAKK